MSYTVLWGRNRDELIHENTYASEQMAWSVYRDLSFTGYAVLMCDGVVIEDNLQAGPVIEIGECE